MRTNSPEIRIRKIADLKPYENSARVHPRDQKRKAKALLKRYGQITPVVVDPNGQLIDGHLVLEVWKELGNDEIATVEVTGRDPSETRALRLALNQLPKGTKWDKGRLRQEFSDLLEIGYDLEFTGFDQGEIDAVLTIISAPPTIVEDAPPAADATAPLVSCLGDVWVLGDKRQKLTNRVICGDARDKEVLAKLRGDLLAHVMFTDPPYNVKVAGNVSGLGARTHREFAMASGEMDRAQFTAFLIAFLQASTETLAEGAVAFLCMDWRHLLELFEAVERVALVQLNLCVWAKTNAGMGSFYRSQHEMILVVKKGTVPHVNNFGLGKNGRSRSNLWTYRGMNVVGEDRDELLKLHPTVKPVALVADAIKDVSRRGDIVLDPFLGSGTTLIAAYETGRRCFGVEYDPLYVDLIVRRWLDHTGGTAIHAETGETFQSREAAVFASLGSSQTEQEG